jgi:surface-anchored protein
VPPAMPRHSPTPPPMTHTTRILLPLLLTAAFAQPAPAFNAILGIDHVDVGLGYSALGGWDLHVHDDTNSAEYEPGEALLFAGVSARINRPASAAFNFIGVGSGEQFWLMPFTQNPSVIFLGIGTDEVESGSFASYLETDSRVNQPGAWIELSLLDVRGPGQVSLWTNDGFGSPIVWWSTAEGGITASDSAFVLSESHAHFNWGFTAAGLYEVDVQATAFLGPGATNPSTSAVATYHFGIEAVPEPGSALLALLGAFTLSARRRRRI